MEEETKLSLFWEKKKRKTTERHTLCCRRVAGRIVFRSAAGVSDSATARANQLPKQQLLADGSVFLIRLLQLWMVHSNQGTRHPLANAAYHTLTGEEEEEREDEGRGRDAQRASGKE